MTKKTVPFSKEFIEKLAEKYPTPFHIYDEKGIRENVRKLQKAFNWADFKEYFAVKANPNPHLLKILKEENCGADCSSLPELKLAEIVGVSGEEIIFSSNDTPAEEFKKAFDLGAIINFDDISHISFFEKNVGALPRIGCFRFNPGKLKKGNEIIGNPTEAKYGFTREQLFAGYKILKEKGVKRFGIHTMVASNELDQNYFVETAVILFDVMEEIFEKLGIEFEFVNLGGGIGIPYHLDQKAVDINFVSQKIKREYKKRNFRCKIFMEMGRMITCPFGFLVTKVLHEKNTYKKFIGVDACMANLMRPAIYGAYHHITILGKENEKATEIYDITGSLCENNDKFAIDRKLPKIEIGDFLVIHDAGAHGHAMGFNYNGKLRSAELLIRENGKVEKIRRAETFEDLTATLDFSKLK